MLPKEPRSRLGLGWSLEMETIPGVSARDAPGWKVLPRTLGEAQPWTSPAILWSGVGLENAVGLGSDGTWVWGKPWRCRIPSCS